MTKTSNDGATDQDSANGEGAQHPVDVVNWYPERFGWLTIIVALLGAGAALALGTGLNPAVVNSLGAFVVAAGAIAEIFARSSEERNKPKKAGMMHNAGLSLLALGAVTIALAPWGGIL